MSPDLSDIPAILREPVTHWFERCGGAAALPPLVAADPAMTAQLVRMVACSPWVGDVFERYPAMLPELVESGRLGRTAKPGEIRELYSAGCRSIENDAGFQRALRVNRHRELARIAWRDNMQAASCEETLADLSAVADAAIGAAVSRAGAELQEKFGTPRAADGRESTFGVLGMGKLGGRELNFSSDVDLIFVYSESGQTDGPRAKSNEEYFRALARRVVALLHDTTSDGFVYRVDTRLRPFGDAGPLAVSLASLESYLTQHGRDWERYAYIKARVINDWDEADALYNGILRPFVYRRYLDFGVFDSLRDMKAMIEAEVRRKEYQNNIKLGRGGIREIEFIVQTLQLVRGGSVAELRRHELLPALEELVRPGCMPADVAKDLRAAYLFLRQFENRLQAINDRQTHDIPAGELNRARMTLAMGFPDWSALDDAVAEQRRIVSRHFHEIMIAGDGEHEADEPQAKLIRAWVSGAPDEELVDVLFDLGYPDPEASLARLHSVRDSGFYRRLDEPGRQRLNTLMPDIVVLAAAQPNQADALSRVLTIIEAIGRRSAYFSLLNENPEALRRLVRLCARSGYLVRQVATHPLLLDELLDDRIVLDAPTREAFAEDLDERLSAAPLGDPEGRRNALRNFQQAAVFRVAVADLSRALPLMHVSDRLTDIAELVLGAALDLAWFELVARHGEPCCGPVTAERVAGLTIVAYGKLGGLELGYGSDLDIVFLHDSSGERQQTNGERSLDNSTFFVRLAQRIIHILTMATASGGMYEVDTRLRPNGQSGLLVSALEAFERYQQENAWTWEHQALLRGRAVAGPAELRDAFAEVRRSILTGFVRRDTLAEDVVGMRTRMRRQLSRGTTELFDIKQGHGGVTDIEFIVQYLALRDAHRNPALIEYSDNIRQIEALAESAILEAAAAEILTEAYKTYRHLMHRLALAGQPALAPITDLGEMPDRVATVWARIFG